MAYTTSRVEEYIADHNRSIIIVMHDDFERHETYAVVRNDESGKYESLVYVAPDDHLEIREYDSGATAMMYITTTALATFARITEDESDTTATLALSKALRDAAMFGVSQNLKRKNCGYMSAELIDLL